MPTKAKYTDEQYQSWYEQLKTAKDGNEANEIFVKNAELVDRSWTSLKMGFQRKAQWKRKQGDASWLKLYEKLYPGKVETLATNLGTFTKNQLIDWIEEFITYPLPNMEYIKSSLEGGMNDKFFQGILATFLMKDIEKYDELWHEHREAIHSDLHARVMSACVIWVAFPLGIAGLLFINLLGDFTLQYKIFSSLSLLVVAGIPIYTYFETLTAFKRLHVAEKMLIERTNKQIMKKYPKELLDTIWNTHQLETIKQNTKDEEHLELAEKVYSGEIDFTENGLMDYAIYELTEVGWFASRFTMNNFKMWQPPHATSKAYRHFYNKAQCNFVDVDAYYRIADRDGWA